MKRKPHIMTNTANYNYLTALRSTWSVQFVKHVDLLTINRRDNIILVPERMEYTFLMGLADPWQACHMHAMAKIEARLYEVTRRALSGLPISEVFKK